jgi:RimJ/RimL family protein N-acetyltransferase
MKLRRLEPRDLEDTFAWRNDPEVWIWCRQYAPLHREKHVEWYDWQAKDPAVSMFAITVAYDEPRLVGVCGLTSIDHVNARAEFSCYIAPEHRGNRYAERALQGLFSHGFDYLNLNSIWGETFEGNPASGLFLKLGMTHDGIRRNGYYRGGMYIDAHLYSLLKSEYLELPWKSHFLF